MLRIAICDDELPAVNIVQGYLDALKENYPDIVYDAYFSGEILIEHYKRAKMEDCYDIIFMDIEMDKSDGLATAAEIRKIDENPLLIYITKYDEYVYNSFETDPFNYLLKPVSQERFTKVFKNAVQKIQKKNIHIHSTIIMRRSVFT